MLANPSALKRLASRQQTDRVDAARLAKMMAMDAVPPVWVPPQGVREARRLLQYRSKPVQQQERCKNQAKAVLRRHGRDNGWVTVLVETSSTTISIGARTRVADH